MLIHCICFMCHPDEHGDFYDIETLGSFVNKIGLTPLATREHFLQCLCWETSDFPEKLYFGIALPSINATLILPFIQTTESPMPILSPLTGSKIFIYVSIFYPIISGSVTSLLMVDHDNIRSASIRIIKNQNATEFSKVIQSNNNISPNPTPKITARNNIKQKLNHHYEGYNHRRMRWKLAYIAPSSHTT